MKIAQVDGKEYVTRSGLAFDVGMTPQGVHEAIEAGHLDRGPIRSYVEWNKKAKIWHALKKNERYDMQANKSVRPGPRKRGKG